MCWFVKIDKIVKIVKIVKMVADLCCRYTSTGAGQVSRADLYTCRLCPRLLCLSPLSHENSSVTDTECWSRDGKGLCE